MVTKTAKSDIKVYKILEEFNGRFIGPYCRGYTYRKGLNVPDFPERYCYYIGEGWLSAYIDKVQAESWKKLWEKDFPQRKYSIHEMAIPNGTEYFERITEGQIRAKKIIWL